METYLVAGLGNPDKKYENTRHNAGFAVIDALSELLSVKVSEEKFRGLCGIAYKNGVKFVLLKPQTYMNLSGESVKPAADYYDIPEDHIIVVYDDINLVPGKLRVRPQGSAGGHNGMKSIIRELGTDGFPRVRVGVGMNEVETPDGEKIRTDLAKHVLAKLTEKELTVMKPTFENAARAVLCIALEGVENAMNQFNTSHV